MEDTFTIQFNSEAPGNANEMMSALVHSFFLTHFLHSSNNQASLPSGYIDLADHLAHSDFKVN